VSEELKFHPLADIFPLMEGAEFDALVADIKANALRYKITLYEGKILDGRNRYRAMLAAGDTPTKEHFFEYKPAVSSDTPLSYVITANLHRRHLTAEDKRKVITKLLKASPEKSDRQIAKAAKASPTFVGKVRAEKEATGDVSTVDTRTDTKGRKQPAKKAPEPELDEEIDVLELVEEVLDGEPLTPKQAATFEKIKKRLRRRARDDAKREAQNEKALNKYKTTLGPFVARLMAAGLARDLWLALTLRGPCGYKEGYAMWLVPPLVEAIEEALGPSGCRERVATGAPTPRQNAPPPEEESAEIMKAQMAALDDGLDIPEYLRRTPKAAAQ
jgi:hypothetical protein